MERAADGPVFEYPGREPFFLCKFLRLLHAAQAAKELGGTTCWLLAVIATTEDAIRYSGPARFWNEELMKACGWRSPKQLEKARDLAIEAGWLKYSRPAKRLIGQYYVEIPERVAALVGQSTGMLYQSPATNEPDNKPANKQANERPINGVIKGTDRGKHSKPIPTPVPKPERLPEKTLAELQLPERYDTPEVVAMLESYAKHWESVNCVRLEQYRLDVVIMEAVRANADPGKLCRWMAKCVTSGKYVNWFDPDDLRPGQQAAPVPLEKRPQMPPRYSHAEIVALQHRNKILRGEIPKDTPPPAGAAELPVILKMTGA
jgi:hypothetical protein